MTISPLFNGNPSVLGRKWYEKTADTRDCLAISQFFNLSPFNLITPFTLVKLSTR